MDDIFSTDTLRQKDRFSYWHDVVARFYAPCLSLTGNKAGFSATTAVKNFGVTEVSEVTSSGISYQRRSCDLKSVPREDIFLSVMMEGQGNFSQNGKKVQHKSGDILIYDSAKTYEFDYSNQYKALLLRIPRPLIQSKIDHLDDLGGTILNGHSCYGRLIHTLLQETAVIASSQELSQQDDLIIPTLDMLTTAIQRGTSADFPLEGRHGKLLSEVKAWIRNHITDENLSVEQIAQGKNISVRTLSRLFAATGETPRSWLQNQRLSCAYEALANRKITNITEAALTFGYKDLSHFSRTFKNKYGYSPKVLIK